MSHATWQAHLQSGQQQRGVKVLEHGALAPAAGKGSKQGGAAARRWAGMGQPALLVQQPHTCGNMPRSRPATATWA